MAWVTGGWPCTADDTGQVADVEMTGFGVATRLDAR